MSPWMSLSPNLNKKIDINPKTPGIGMLAVDQHSPTKLVFPFSVFLLCFLYAAANRHTEHPDLLYGAETPQPGQLC